MKLESEHRMPRRQFLGLAAASSFMFIAPGVWALPAGNAAHWDRVLLLVELKGGNDGLNTVIPFAEQNYYAARPSLAVARDKVLMLDEHLGLNPKLEPLMQSWRDKDFAIALGMGYDNPNRSHFRSIEIWETGSNSDEFRGSGWLAQVFQQHRPPAEMTAEGIVLGDGDAGPLAGASVRAISMDTPAEFIRNAKRVKEPAAAQGNAALRKVLSTQQEIRSAAATLETKLDQGAQFKTQFPRTKLGEQMESAAKLIASKTPVAVIKVSHGSFDTHNNQQNTHERLLGELAAALAAFRAAMQEISAWDRVLVSTYSEFGRRVHENGSRGTDHGAAAPHFFMGGRVNGGLYGQQPSMANLQNGDLAHTVDYRSLYSTVSQRWWGLDRYEGHAPLECLKT